MAENVCLALICRTGSTRLVGIFYASSVVTAMLSDWVIPGEARPLVRTGGRLGMAAGSILS